MTKSPRPRVLPIALGFALVCGAPYKKAAAAGPQLPAPQPSRLPAPSAQAPVRGATRAVDFWAAELLDAALGASAFQSSQTSLQFERTEAEAAARLAGWQLSSQANHIFYPSLGVGSASSQNTAQATVSRYVGFGLDLTGGIQAAQTSYAGSGTVPSRSQGVLDFALEADLDILRNFKGRYETNQRQSAVRNLLASELDLQAGREDLAQNVLESALDVCVSRNRIETTDKILTQAKKLYDRVRSQGRAGIVGTSDLVQFAGLILSLQRSQAEQSRAQEFSIEQLKERFRIAIGPASCPVLEMQPASTSELKGLGQNQAERERLLASNPSLQASQERVKIRENERALAQWDLLPTLQPFVAVNTAGSPINLQGAANGFGNDRRTTTVGVKLSWAIPGARENLQAKAATQQLLAETVTQKAILDALDSKALDAVRDQKLAEELYDVTVKQIKISQQFLEIENSRYLIGRSSALTLTQAYQSYFGATTALPQLAAQYIRSEWRALALRGKLIATLTAIKGNSNANRSTR